jgi:catechol-2,3-dioxygenase
MNWRRPPSAVTDGNGWECVVTTVLGVTLDCVDIERVAQFWAHVLGIEVVDRLSPRVRALEVPVGDQRLLVTFRQVTGAKVTANRVRLDLQTAELENETARLLSLGAIRIASDRVAHRWAILADVEGNEFDLVDERGPGELAGGDTDRA